MPQRCSRDDVPALLGNLDEEISGQGESAQRAEAMILLGGRKDGRISLARTLLLEQRNAHPSLVATASGQVAFAARAGGLKMWPERWGNRG